MFPKLLILALCVLLTACGSKHNNTEQHSSDDYKKYATDVPFAGFWLSENYYNTLMKTKSPRKAQGDCELFEISPETTVRTTEILNFHEGIQVTVVKNRGQFELWNTDDSLFVEKQGDIKIMSRNKIKIGSVIYRKVHVMVNENDIYLLEELLFNGSYMSDKGENIKMSRDGKVSGLSGFRYYLPRLDYWDAGLNIDLVELGSSKENMTEYGFRFNRDTLELYQINCLEKDAEGECVEIGYGTLYRKLWKR